MKFCVTLPKFLSFGIKYQGRGIPWNIISLYKQKQKYVDRLPLPDNSGPLQEVVGDITTGHPTGPVEVNLDELAEARGVVVPRCLCIAKRLQDWVGLESRMIHNCTSIFNISFHKCQ